MPKELIMILLYTYPHQTTMDYNFIIDKYCKDNNELRDILVTHSRAVAEKALAIADAHPELGLDRQFILEAAMVHDIGIVMTDAPGIKCFGTEPYIRHGVCGAEIMRAEGYPRHARVCERHTGAGLSKAEIEAQDLPLPRVDLLPETLEEKVICYADKFFSKTRLDREKTIEQAERSVAKHGDEGLKRFKEMERLFR
jgi:uncharacterized protein